MPEEEGAGAGRTRRALIWAALVVALVAVIGAAVLERLRREKAPPFLGQVPPFSLLDEQGRPFALRDLAGRPWIADFVFTRCQASCPMMTARMARLDRELPRGSEVGLLSLSVDPAHDRPEVLAGYARSFDASPRWRFLTGETEAVYTLVRGGFKLGVDPTPQAAPGPTSDASGTPEPITHSTRFVLIDGRARIRGYYDAFDAEEVARLKRDLRAVEQGG
jgi:protein SCO1/2